MLLYMGCFLFEVTLPNECLKLYILSPLFEIKKFRFFWDTCVGTKPHIIGDEDQWILMNEQLWMTENWFEVEVQTDVFLNLRWGGKIWQMATIWTLSAFWWKESILGGILWDSQVVFEGNGIDDVDRQRAILISVVLKLTACCTIS